MNRIVITLTPPAAGEQMLPIADAMQQVLDAMRLFEEAERSLGEPQEAVTWRLERASANSPFTVVALAEPRNPTVDVTRHVRRVKTEVANGVRGLIRDRRPPRWLTPEGVKVAQALFARGANGIALTHIDIEDAGDAISIDRAEAEAGVRAIAAITALAAADDIAPREAFGEIEGAMVAVGRYRRRPAITIRSDLYGFVWCVLSEKLTNRFGGQHKVAEVWQGRTIGVTGNLYYEAGGALRHMDAVQIREITTARPIDLNSVLDPDFTAGLDPVEYLEKLHAGELA
jgi:hypothetical protein